MIRRFTLLLALLAASSCGGSEAEAPRRVVASPSATFPVASALIDTGEGSVLLTVEIAQSPEQRQQGLMHREHLDEDAGMVFLFFEETTGGFYMKNTKVPLSIAFFDVDGRILEIMDMDPCRKDPCRIYDPGVAYMGALEVNQGAFEQWGVEVGDRIQVTQ